MEVRIIDRPWNPWSDLQTYQAQHHARGGSFGATASFVGTMRDINEGEFVTALTLEHYPGMTENYLARIGEEAKQRWKILDILVVHRVGHISPGEPIVLVAVWAAHRSAAFEACRFLMEELKSRAPFWKKEILDKGESRWVEHNTPGTTDTT